VDIDDILLTQESSCPSPSGNRQSVTQDFNTAASPDLFPDFQLTENTGNETLPSPLSPSQAPVAATPSSPILPSNMEAPSESESEVTLQLSADGPATRSSLMKKFINKMARKESYFNKFCNVVAMACNSKPSESNIIHQSTILIKKTCVTSIPTVQNNFGLQGTIQRIVPKVVSILADKKKSPSK